MSTPERFSADDTHAATDATTTVCERVVQEISETTGKDLTDFEPLYNVIDPDALNNLFESTSGGSRAGGRVVFTVAECEVVVESTGTVEATPLDANEHEVTGSGLQ